MRKNLKMIIAVETMLKEPATVITISVARVYADSVDDALPSLILRKLIQKL